MRQRAREREGRTGTAPAPVLRAGLSESLRWHCILLARDLQPMFAMAGFRKAQGWQAKVSGPPVAALFCHVSACVPQPFGRTRRGVDRARRARLLSGDRARLWE